MLFRAAFWRAEVIAWGSTSIPTDKAAPNYTPSHNDKVGFEN